MNRPGPTEFDISKYKKNELVEMVSVYSECVAVLDTIVHDLHKPLNNNDISEWLEILDKKINDIFKSKKEYEQFVEEENNRYTQIKVQDACEMKEY